MCWVAAGQGGHVGAAGEVLHHAAGHEHERAEHRDRQQDPQHDPDQVDPEVAQLAGLRLRANPRTSATATAMPTAAETKFCTASPAICTRWPIVDSPEYDCQLVLVTKLTAVFQRLVRASPGRSPSDSHRWSCTRWNT